MEFKKEALFQKITSKKSAMTNKKILPLKVYGSEISYFTGKLECYLRYKEIPYKMVPAKFSIAAKLLNTGVKQVPCIQLADERWMTDSTPMIEWFENEFPHSGVTPLDHELAFFSHLLEDYADEWLWRPAMHYRWHYKWDSALLSRKISDELLDLPLPTFIKMFLFKKRQQYTYTIGDGMTKKNVESVERIYLNTLEHLQAILKSRPYLLGNKPSLVDFGFAGPFFRHFGQDPTPSLIMREKGPAVYEWIARLWNAKYSNQDAGLLERIPDDWGPILDDIGKSYLPYLNANIASLKENKERFSVEINGVYYKKARTSRYRAWCLEKLRDRFNGLPQDIKQIVENRLKKHHCWDELWKERNTNSGIQADSVPFLGEIYKLGI